MTVKIDRYKKRVFNKGTSAIITDLLYHENIVTIDTRNPILTEKLCYICMEDLNKGFETNDVKL